MEAHTTKNGIPKFAMDDVEIVLDELCSGYDKVTESRMRKELFDHYQSAFDDAIDDGLSEEETHKKVLQDLGWETTLMVGRVCREIGGWSKGTLQCVAYRRKVFTKKSFRLITILCVIYLLISFLGSIYFAYHGEIFQSVSLPIGVILLTSLLFFKMLSSMKTPDTQPLVTVLILKKRIRSCLYLGIGASTICAIQIVYLSTCGIWILTIPILCLGLAFLSGVYSIMQLFEFIRVWNRQNGNLRLF